MDAIDRIRKERTDLLKGQVIEDENRRRMYAQTFDTDSGRRVLLDMLTRSYFFSSSFTGNSHSYFNEGARQWALELMRIIPAISGQVIATYLAGVEETLAEERKKEIV